VSELKSCCGFATGTVRDSRERATLAVRSRNQMTGVDTMRVAVNYRLLEIEISLE
jgi:hypothetical protein